MYCITVRRWFDLADQAQVLKDNELKEYLNKFRGRVPSVLLDDLYNKLKGKGVTREQVDKIVKKIEENLTNARKIDEIFRKLENIESLIRQRMKEEKREAKIEPLPEFLKQQQQQPVQQPTFQPTYQQPTQPQPQQPQPQPQPQTQQPVQQVQLYQTEEPLLPSLPTEKPRLEDVPLHDTRAIMILLKWIEFMLERVGHEGLRDLLNYYVDINWISEKVLFTVLRFAKGIRLYHENSDWRPAGYMNVKDHMTSLLFIEALRTGRFDKDVVLKVERDIYSIRKEVSEINGF